MSRVVMYLDGSYVECEDLAVGEMAGGDDFLAVLPMGWDAEQISKRIVDLTAENDALKLELQESRKASAAEFNENAKLRALVERGKRVLRMVYAEGKAYQFDCEEALK